MCICEDPTRQSCTSLLPRKACKTAVGTEFALSRELSGMEVSADLSKPGFMIWQQRVGRHASELNPP